MMVTHRQYIFLSLSLVTVSLSSTLSLSLYLYPLLYTSLHPHLYLYPYHYFTLYPYLHLYLCSFLCPFLCPFLHLYLYLVCRQRGRGNSIGSISNHIGQLRQTNRWLLLSSLHFIQYDAIQSILILMPLQPNLVASIISFYFSNLQITLYSRLIFPVFCFSLTQLPSSSIVASSMCPLSWYFDYLLSLPMT